MSVVGVLVVLLFSFLVDGIGWGLSTCSLSSSAGMKSDYLCSVVTVLSIAACFYYIVVLTEIYI